MMELSAGYIVILGIIIMIGLLGMVGNMQLAHFYRKCLAKLQDYESREEFDARPGEDHLIQDMVTEYTRHRSQGIEMMNTQAIIEKKLYGQQLPLFGFFHLPVNIVERIIQQLPSWSVIIGLLGTFSGLTMALFAMQDTLLQLGTDMGEEMMTVSTIVAAIAQPFQGMSFAFMTSIAGIGASFFLHVLHSGLLSRLGLGPSVPQLKNMLLTRCESFLDHQVQQAIQKAKPKDTLEKVLDRLVDKVKESFDASIKGFGDEILHMTHHLQKSTSGLKDVIQHSASFMAHFEQGTAELGQFSQDMREYIHQLEQRESQTAGQMGQLAQNIATLGQEFKQLSKQNEQSRQSLQKVLERSDQLIQQTTRKNEEVFQFFKQQTQDIQQHFQMVLEEERRGYQQQQEQLAFRYQEKNDQFSRAAESFGQAVQHLERQWNDGMERMKRDMAHQWGQLFEQYFGRWQQQQTDVDLREITRAVDGLQHLLDREFGQQHRYVQDMQQILLSFYEWARAQAEQRGSVRQDVRHDQNGATSPIVRGSRY